MDAYLGEIRAFAFNYAPLNWAFCNGQQLPIAQFQALYAVIGSLYGPATSTAFTLPDLRGRAPMQWGAQPGGQPSFAQGAQVGAESVTLTENQTPTHTHQMAGVTNPTATLLTQVPTTTSQLFRPYQASTSVGFLAWNTNNNPDGLMAAAAVQTAGSGQSHENRQPYLTLNFCICLDGDWPEKPSHHLLQICPCAILFWAFPVTPQYRFRSDHRLPGVRGALSGGSASHAHRALWRWFQWR